MPDVEIRRPAIQVWIVELRQRLDGHINSVDVARQIIDRMRPRVGDKQAHAFGEPSIELELHRMVRGTAIAPKHVDGCVGQQNISREPASRGADISGRKCLLPDRLL